MTSVMSHPSQFFMILPNDVYRLGLNPAKIARMAYLYAHIADCLPSDVTCSPPLHCTTPSLLAQRAKSSTGVSYV
ncbi:hypothetical protein [Tortoise microvirus 2]|nr:hypothetical protein [Tortoise microvirus 2]QCS37434.1 hypothetical protein [Tortoise microvirus 2]QPB07429.1 MAG: hypothetical protein [Microvirus sp.]